MLILYLSIKLRANQFVPSCSVAAGHVTHWLSACIASFYWSYFKSCCTESLLSSNLNKWNKKWGDLSSFFITTTTSSLDHVRNTKGWQLSGIWMNYQTGVRYIVCLSSAVMWSFSWFITSENERILWLTMNEAGDTNSWSTTDFNPDIAPQNVKIHDWKIWGLTTDWPELQNNNNNNNNEMTWSRSVQRCSVKEIHSGNMAAIQGLTSTEEGRH